MTTAVLLIRHGSHDRLGRILCGRMAGVSLSSHGRGEAAALARALRSHGPVDAFYSGPLERTRETAEIVAAAFGAPVDVDDDLDELDFGEWTGLGFDALQSDPRWTAWNRDRDQARAPRGEAMLEAQVRMARCLARLHLRHPDATVAAVGHADVIKTGLAWALGLPLAFHSRFEVAPASISRILIGDGEVKVMNINQTCAP
ncbi:MAG TPA: histidine phosphatase family protein [Lichenihabitans sp.]|jgi:probable phosphoglycerate mutase|nr:histidine phosphatase family protein [Lichenihabitans sp.]